MLGVWLVVVLFGGTAIAAPPYAASIRAPQIELDLDLESPHDRDSIRLDAGGTSPVSPLLDRRQSTGTYRFDFKWVKRWAAIGDSYTAGIGAGSKLGSLVKNTDDYWCSRYTHAWPRLMAKWLGGDRNFQFPACSGARSTDIYQQANSLTGLLDLVVMTAGGNDMCLNSLVKSCVVTAYSGERACDDAIAKAETNLRTIVKTNLRYIFDALMYKMADDGMVMILGYAPFFDATNEACTQQDWAVPSYGSVRYQLGTGLRLTTARRARLNKLVHDMNDALRELVDEYSVNGRPASIELRFVDWSGWPAAVGGEMCSPLSDGIYPDPKQPKLLFFKPPTKPQIHDELRRRALNDSDIFIPAVDADEQNPVQVLEAAGPGQAARGLNRSREDQTLSTPEMTVQQLDKRAPTPPTCPSDNTFADAAGKLIPDYFSKWFHPNIRGHGAMASFMLKNIAIEKGKLMGVPGADVCVRVDKDAPQCFGANPNRKNLFVTWRSMDENIKDFCETMVIPDPLYPNWEATWTYNKGTPDEFDVLFKMRHGAAFWGGSEQCKKNFLRLVHGCDVNRPDNPMNYKWGGRWARYNEIYEIKPKTERKLHTRPDGRCRAKNSGAWHAYKVEGRGWSSADKGNKLWENIRECAGDACASFRFGYYKKDEHEDDWEWWATFTCPKGKVEHCWNNQEVQKATGGWTHKWRRNSANERYEEGGCTRDMSY